jgi:hypothetical protein
VLGKLLDAAKVVAALMIPVPDGGFNADSPDGADLYELPAVCQGAYLAFAKTVDTASIPDSLWYGEQLLLIYLNDRIAALGDTAASFSISADRNPWQDGSPTVISFARPAPSTESHQPPPDPSDPTTSIFQVPNRLGTGTSSSRARSARLRLGEVSSMIQSRTLRLSERSSPGLRMRFERVSFYVARLNNASTEPRSDSTKRNGAIEMKKSI